MKTLTAKCPNWSHGSVNGSRTPSVAPACAIARLPDVIQEHVERGDAAQSFDVREVRAV